MSMWGPLRFYRESRSYMAGYSIWYFWRHFPKAFVRFYAMSARDLLRARRSVEWIDEE